MNSNLSQNSVLTNHEHRHKSISWSAIFIGAFFGIGSSFLLNLFGVAVGLSAFNAATPQTLAIGGILGLIIVSIFSMSILGWTAGFIGATKKLCCHNKLQCNYGCIYGFGAWCVALVLSVLLVMPTSHFVSRTLLALNPSLTSTMFHNQDGKVSNINPSSTTNSVGQAQGSTNDVAMDNETHKALATTSFIAFLIFFIGALSAIIAGHCGYKHYERNEE